MTDKTQPTNAGAQQAKTLRLAKRLLDFSSDHNGKECVEASAMLLEQYARIAELESLQSATSSDERLKACREAFARYSNHVADNEGTDFLSANWGFSDSLATELQTELEEMLKVREPIDAARAAQRARNS